jgi:acyl-CoA synthetase (NDP forming)
MGEAGARMGKPVCFPYTGGWTSGPGTFEAESNPDIGCFQSINSCYATLAAWRQFHDRLQAQARDGARDPVRVSPLRAKDDAAKLIAAAPAATLTEREAKQVLAAYGVPVVQERVVRSADEAVEAARALGMPVALKLESPDVPHKTEAGVIRLDLGSAEQVRAAYDAIMANAAKISPAPVINGVLVQPMVPAGVEIMVGARVDPLFGPLIVVGLGGIFVELLKDTALELTPITRAEARGMRERLKGKRLFEGFRGGAAVDLDALAPVIVRLAELAADQQHLVAELDVNPLICAGDRVIAVDALIVRAPVSA